MELNATFSPFYETRIRKEIIEDAFRLVNAKLITSLAAAGRAQFEPDTLEMLEEQLKSPHDGCHRQTVSNDWKDFPKCKVG